MNRWQFLLLAVSGWTALGIVGTLLSMFRGERRKAAQGIKWLLATWVIYLTMVIGVSIVQPRRVVAIGQEQCFAEMCFTVVGVDELPQFLGKNQTGNGSRLVRVSVRVRNTAAGKAQSEGRMQAYLVDSQGRRWEESRGVSGNRLTGQVEASGVMLSQPMFHVAGDATGLELVFTHGRWQPGALVIGDSDSLWHRKTVVPLGR
ncbi:MAG: hypothetical protein JWM43_331 [Acidobacteriaceae bacterium]|nr:hypothetical protein [Acidobacteriaceae bacterium]